MPPILEQNPAVNQPITANEISLSAGTAPDPKYTDEAVIRIVMDDYHTGVAWLESESWNLQWKESRVLYQSPRGMSYFEGTDIPRSNVSRFTVAKQVNSLAPSISGAIFSDPTPFEVQPRPRTTSNTARAWKAMLSFLIEEARLKQVLAVATEGMVNQGTCLVKWGWKSETVIEKHMVRKAPPPTVPLPMGQQMNVYTSDSDEFEVEEKEVTRSRPWIEKVPLGRVVVDPKWDKPNQIWEAAWICDNFYVTYEDLKLLAQNPEYDIPDEATLRAIFLGDQEQTEGIEGVEAELNQLGDSSISHAERPDATTSEDPLEKPMHLVERWTDDECWVVLQGKVVIRKGRHNLPEKPFGSANFWNMEDTGYGLGVGRIAGADQRVDQGTINAALDIISFAVNPEYAVSRSANAPQSDMRRRLGGIRPVDGPAEAAYKLIEQPKVPADVWTVTQLSTAASESATGADQATVQGTIPGGKSSFGRSGTGAGAVARASAGRIQAPVDRLIDGIFLPFIEFCYQMTREGMPTSEIRSILSDEMTADLIGDMHDFLNARVKFDTLAGTRLAARQQAAQALPFLLQVFQSSELIQQLNTTGYKVDVMELVNMVMDTSGWKNNRDLIVPLSQQEQQMMQQQSGQNSRLAAQMQLLQAKQHGDQELEDMKIHGRIATDSAKQVTAKTVGESPLDRAASFATRDQLEQEMKQSAYFGGGQ